MASPTHTTATTSSPSLPERQKTALSELSSLARVSHRLALVDTTERLQQVLDKLLPRLLKRIGENHKEQLMLATTTTAATTTANNDPYKQLKEAHDKIHAKLVEMLSHTMKRVRDDQVCQLPCRAILALLLLEEDETDENGGAAEAKNTSTPVRIPKAKPVVDPFTLNLALAFLTLGVPRISTRLEVEALLPDLLVLVGQYSGLGAIRTAAKKMQSHQVAHLLLRAIEWQVKDENDLAKPTYGGKAEKAATATPGDVKHPEPVAMTSMALARHVCQLNPRAAGAVFEVLLDGLLYQPVAGNVPPNGLSQAGHERLKQGNSTTARDWAAEKAPRMKLMEFKLALLDFVAPSRRWAIFMGQEDSSSRRDSSTASTVSEAGDEEGDDGSTGVSRTVALLVAASGDPNVEVSQRATTYLKMHHDSFRRANKQEANPESSTSSNNEMDATVTAMKARAVGDPVGLTCGLLSLALGQTNAESAMTKIAASSDTARSLKSIWLGLPPDQAAESDSSQLILSLKRRATSEATMATIMNYVADKILEENPNLLQDAGVTKVQQLATLPLLVAQRTLSNLRTSSGLSVLQAKAFVAAAKLLNILCVRVSSFYDSPSFGTGVDAEEKKEETGDSNAVVLKFMARALATACSVLAPASTSMAGASTSSAMVSNEGNIAIRDACYGVLCSLSRSRFALAAESYIFTRGNTDHPSNGEVVVVAIDTASLLFGCAANEVENLRPRAVAALDALLGAYCRVYATKDPIKVPDLKPTENSKANLPLNPWAITVSDVHRSNNENAHSSLLLDTQGLTKALLPLLWSAGQTSQPKASRVAAARWSSDLLKELDIASSSHILCFLAGDKDVTASSIAREGLGLPSKHDIASSDDDDYLVGGFTGSSVEEPEGLPDFGDYTSIIFPAKSAAQSSSAYWRPQYWDFSFAGKAAALRFGLVCLFNDMYGGDDEAVKVFVAALADTLVLFGAKASGVTESSKVQGREAIELLEECTRCLVATVSTSHHTRSLLVKAASSISGVVSLSLQDIEYLAQTANSSRARRHLAAACGHLYDDMSLWTDGGKPSLGVQEWLQKSGVHSTLDTCSRKLTDMHHNLFMVGDIHGAAFLGAQCVRAFMLWANRSGAPNSQDADETLEASCWQNSTKIIKALGLGILHSDDVVANACADGLAAALVFSSIDAPILDPRLYEGTASALNNLAKALKKFSGTDHLDSPRTSKLAYAVGNCLAASTSGAGVVSEQGSTDDSLSLGPARLTCVDALFSLLGSPAFRAHEEVALVAGEALAIYADAYAPDSAVWSANASVWPADFDEDHAKGLPPHQQVLYTLIRGIYPSSSPHKKTACASAMLGVVGRAANGVNKHEERYSKRFLVVEIERHMSEVQGLFIALLSNPKSQQLSRESCCLGLAACRGITKEKAANGQTGFTSDELNQRLLRSFGQTTNFGGSAYQETPGQAAQRRSTERSESGATETSGSNVMEPFGGESEVGGASGLGESALNSYKEMASAAVSLGRIDILYALLLLSVSHETWFTHSNKYKYGASSLLGDDSIVGSRTNSAELRTALRPHLNKLLPRILRACHDPNKQTREQMNSLWIGLTGGGSEARSAITQHLLPTVDTLIEDCTNKLWRARAGACGALAEIIVGRSWFDLGGGPGVLDDDDVHTRTTSSNLTAGIRLLRLFRVAMRSLDDVRGNVREAGESLARAVRGLSIRLCNPSLKDSSNGAQQLTKEEVKRHEVNASSAAATTLRWLIKYGLNQQCAEATGICLSCLVEIVGVVKPKILERLIPDLLKSLLVSMSGLEPAALNYLQARSGAHSADSSLSYENLERVRLRLAQSGPLAAAVTKLLDMLPSVTVDTQKEVVPQLDSALRQSVGFATRAATADAVAVLCSSCPSAFHFPGASNTNPSVRLLRALYFASERERGQGARDKMIHALGNLAALCPGSSVRILAMKACEKYNKSTGNNDDPASRRASAAALRSIAVRASTQFSDGGPHDIWFRTVLPVAFLGQKDSDAKISSLWKEVWEEGSIAINVSHASGEDGFGTTIEEKLLPYLVQECCRALGDLSWTRRVAGSTALVDLCAAGVLSPSPRQLAPSSVDAYSMRRSQRRAQAAQKSLNASLRLLSGSRLWTGKSEVIGSAVSIATKFSGYDDSLDLKILLGWDRDGACPWQPILVAPGKFSDDLFVEDGWFGQTHGEEEDEPNDQVVPKAGDDMNVDFSEAEGQLDFEACDKLTDNEDDNRDSDVEGRVEKETSVATFAGLARFLVDQAMPSQVSRNLAESEEFLPYRVSAFKNLSQLLASLNDSSVLGTEQKKDIYTRISPRLVSLCDLDNRFGSKGKTSKSEPPVLAARAIDCLSASFWNGIGLATDVETAGTTDVLELMKFLISAGGSKQPAWTVREASWLCVASLASVCHPCALRDHKVVSTMVECAVESLKDRKFWRVRLSGLKLLRALVARAGTRAIASVSQSTEEQDRQLLLEAMLPQKEDILKLARKSLSDPEAKVTALSSEVISMMSWWP